MQGNIFNDAYNNFPALDNATKVITDLLVDRAPNLWKLLYYTDPVVFPLEQPDLTSAQISAMIVQTPQDMYDSDVSSKKNFLFQIDTDEALSVAVPQVRMELGDIQSIDRTRGFVNITLQVVIPNKQRLFLSSYSSVADRRVAIVRELLKALNGTIVNNSGFYSPLFVDRSAPNGAGRSTGAYVQTFNKNFSGYYLTFTALL